MAEPLFELPDVIADGHLRDTDLPRAITETAVLHDLRENFELADSYGGHAPSIREKLQRDKAQLYPRFENDIRGYEKGGRSEEHTSELQSLMRISYAVFCLKKKTRHK